jgi:hypothetical protein
MFLSAKHCGKQKTSVYRLAAIITEKEISGIRAAGGICLQSTKYKVRSTNWELGTGNWELPTADSKRCANVNSKPE